MTLKSIEPIKVFLCCAPQDSHFRDELEKHLTSLKLKRWGWITIWHNGMISAGTEREKKIYEQINTADIIVLLTSTDFMSSDACCGEMECSLERWKAKKTRVIPTIIRPTNWEGVPFSIFQVLPNEGKPLTLWRNPDEAYCDIAAGMEETADELLPTKGTKEQWLKEGRRFIKEGQKLGHDEDYEKALRACEYGLRLVQNDRVALIQQAATL